MNDSLILVAVAIMGGVIYLLKGIADKAKAAEFLAHTKGIDSILKENQAEIEKQLEEIKSQDDSKLSPDQRADRWNK